MSKKICCPKCKSENIRSVDNQPLHYASKSEVAVTPSMRIDTEIYITLICDDCNPMAKSDGYFTKIFDLIPRN